MTGKHEQMIERIYSEIVGDEYTEGIIPQIKKHEKKISLHDTYFKVLLWGGVALVSIIAFWKDIQSLM